MSEKIKGRNYNQVKNRYNSLIKRFYGELKEEESDAPVKKEDELTKEVLSRYEK